MRVNKNLQHLIRLLQKVKKPEQEQEQEEEEQEQEEQEQEKEEQEGEQPEEQQPEPEQPEEESATPAKPIQKLATPQEAKELKEVEEKAEKSRNEVKALLNAKIVKPKGESQGRGNFITQTRFSGAEEEKSKVNTATSKEFESKFKEPNNLVEKDNYIYKRLTT